MLTMGPGSRDQGPYGERGSPAIVDTGREGGPSMSHSTSTHPAPASERAGLARPPRGTGPSAGSWSAASSW